MGNSQAGTVEAPADNNNVEKVAQTSEKPEISDKPESTGNMSSEPPSEPPAYSLSNDSPTGFDGPIGNYSLQNGPCNKQEVQALTWNGALSYSTVSNPLVELFFKSVRNIACTDYRCITVKQGKKQAADAVGTDFENLFDAAWKYDPLRTLKFVFHLRDCRGGKGERKLFRALVRHMRTSDYKKHLVANIEHIPYFGSWKDVSMCFFGTELEDIAVEMIANQLLEDFNSKTPSLCAKYAPSEKGAIDTKHGAANKISAKMGVSLTKYRKRFLTPLRQQIKVLERDMCAKRWSEINYEHVPSIANSRYSKAFKRNDEARYTEYLDGVKKGVKKMNTSVLMPYQIVAPYINNGKLDETLEAQWVSFIKDRKAKWPAGYNVMPLIDVSGSMCMTSLTPKPLEVAISLGMLFATLNSTEQYANKFITFHEHPQLLSFPEGSLQSKVNYIKSTPWGGSTNFQSAFDLLLNIATTFKLTQEQLPKILLVLSDMQFNQAGGNRTNWETIEKKYKEAGYVRPIIIFWNLNGSTSDFPVPHDKVENCAMLSGFNDASLNAVFEGKLPTPADIVLKALDNSRYDIIKLAN